LLEGLVAKKIFRKKFIRQGIIRRAMSAFGKAWAFLKNDDAYYTGFNKVGDRIYPDGTFIPDDEMTDEEHMQMVRDHMALPIEDRRAAETPRFSIDYTVPPLEHRVRANRMIHENPEFMIQEMLNEGKKPNKRIIQGLKEGQNFNTPPSKMDFDQHPLTEEEKERFGDA
jgi:hypothetical protein